MLTTVLFILPCLTVSYVVAHVSAVDAYFIMAGKLTLGTALEAVHFILSLWKSKST